MKTLTYKICLLFGGAVLAFFGDLGADENHYKNILVGDRAATMGGSYTAISDDTSGAYYNPAGLVYSAGDSVSGSANTYHTTTTEYDEAIGDNDWKRESSALLPNFFGIVKKFGPHTFAITYAVPDSGSEHQDQTFTNLGLTDTSADVYRYVINLHLEDNTYLFGPSYAVQLTDSLSFGVTLYYYYRLYRSQLNEFIQRYNTKTEWKYQTQKITETGINPRVGIQWTPIEPLSIGFSISRTELLSSSVKTMLIEKKADEDIGDYTYSGKNNNKRTLATKYSLGVSLFPSPFSLFTLDIDYYAAGKNRDDANNNESENKLSDVMNFSFGSEIFINETNALRFGLFSNLTNQEKPDDSTSSVTHLDMYGATMGYSLYTRSSSVTLGMIYSQGSGESQLYADSSNTVDINRRSITFLFAASYGY